MSFLGNEHVFGAVLRKTSAKALLANNVYVCFLWRDPATPCSIFHPKKAYEQMESCSSLRALKHDYFSGFMEKESKEFGI